MGGVDLIQHLFDGYGCLDQAIKARGVVILSDTSWIGFMWTCKTSNHFRISMKTRTRSRSRSDLRLSRFWFLNLLKRQCYDHSGIHGAASQDELEHARQLNIFINSGADMELILEIII